MVSGELGHQGAVDQGDGDEEAEPEAERDRDLAGDRSRPRDARERQRPGRRLGAAEARRELLQQPAEAVEQQEGRDDAGRDRGGDQLLFRGREPQAEQGEAAQGGAGDEAPARALALLGEVGPHQDGRRHRGCAAEGQKHEQQHGEEPGRSRDEERPGMRLDGEGDGNGVAVDRRDDGRGQGADDEPDGDAEARQQNRLDQIDLEHEPARSAEALEGRDHRAASWPCSCRWRCRRRCRRAGARQGRPG